MSEATLVKLIETKLQQWADTQDIKIAFEGVRFTPPAEATYARIDHLPATTTNAFLEGGHKALTGLYQVGLIGLKGKGLGPLRELAATLSTAFPAQLVLTSGTFRVQITTPISIGPKVDDPEGSKTARVMLPCSFGYRADVVT